MSTTELRFVSSNPHKVAEAKVILGAIGVAVIPVPLKIDELQTLDADALVRDKLLKAFKRIGKPLFVEHTGLSLTQLNGFPGGLTQIFWDTLSADRFGELFGIPREGGAVVARTTVAYCDGKTIHTFDGECSGHIVAQPRGSRAFQWDCVFQPLGHSRTFAEMGNEKNEISMRRLALDKLASFLATRGLKR
jgi:XTP/dITP diphosphohydrolase